MPQTLTVLLAVLFTPGAQPQVKAAAVPNRADGELMARALSQQVALAFPTSQLHIEFVSVLHRP